MERKKIVVCCVVGFLGLLSAATAFAAEATRIKQSDVKSTPLKCIYPKSTPSFALGITSLVSLVITKFLDVGVLHSLPKNPREPRQSKSKETYQAGCISLSWITGGDACVLLVYGILFNSRHGEVTNIGYCQVVNRGFTTFAGVLSLASVAFSIISYLSLPSTSKNSLIFPGDVVPAAPSQGGIALG